MRPSKLSIRGINSYVEEQTIDFGKLGESGLFGIFGPTGSGKSTIIDAITLALYGAANIPRDSSEFVNLMSDSASVSMEFVAGTSVKKRFVVERTFKRNSSGGLKTSSARIREMADDGTVADVYDKVRDVDSRIAEIIGLSSDDFKRAVVLPQGKFGEFLKLKGMERRKMLERLLNLEAYGKRLSDRANKLYSNAGKQLEYLKGRLDGLESVSVDALKEREKALEGVKAAATEAEASVDDMRAKHSEIKALADRTREFEIAVKSRNLLALREEGMGCMKADLHRAEKALVGIQPFNRLKEVDGEISKAQEAFSQKSESLDVLKPEYEAALKLFDDIRREYDDKYGYRVEMRSKLTEASGIKSGIDSDSLMLERGRCEIERAREKVGDADKDANVISSEILTIEGEMSEALKDLKVIAESRVDQSTMIELGKVNEGIMNIDSRIRSARLEIESEHSRSTDMETSVKAAELRLAEIGSRVQDLDDRLSESKAMFEHSREVERNHSILRSMSESLKSGKPCPLCGSEDHPAPWGTGDESDIDRVRRSNEALAYEIEAMVEETGKLSKEKWGLEGSVKAKIEALEESRHKIDAMRHANDSLADRRKDMAEKFSELLSATGSGDFESLMRESEESESKRAGLDIRLEKLRGLQSVTAAKLESARAASQSSKETLARLHGNEESLLRSLAALEVSLNEKLEELGIKSPEDIDGYLADITEWIDSIVLKKKDSEQRKEYLEERFKVVSEEVSRLSGDIRVLMSSREAVEAEFGIFLSDNFPEGVSDFESAVRDDIEMSEMKRRIREYDNEVLIMEETVSRLEKDLNGKRSSQEDVDLILLELTRKSEELKALQENIGALSGEVDEIRSKLSEKVSLSRDFEVLTRRYGKINEVRSLLSANKFVDFIAQKHLRRIATSASERLSDITGNKYALTTDEEGNFSIIDLSSGGLMRDCGTLSGGETFVASLALALAVSNHFQMKGRTSLDFFILDEGFGTLDKELLEIVMNSLDGLRKNDMLIGVVTHVEEIKHRIAYRIMVESAVPGVRGTKVSYDFA